MNTPTTTLPGLLALSLSLTLTLAAVSPAAAVAPQTAAATAAQPDLSTPRKTVEAFFAAYNRGDLKGMAPCVLGADLTPGLETAAAEFARGPRPGTALLSDLRVYTDEAGTECLVKFGLDLKGLKAAPGVAAAVPGELAPDPARERDVVLLRKADGAWKIVPPAYPDSKAGQSALGQSELDATNALALLLRYPDALMAANRTAKSALARSNAKQVCLGLLMYAQDYDDVLPPDPARYQDAVDPYIKNRSVFTSPFDPAGTVSLKLNPQVARRNLSRFARPEGLVLVFEGEYKKPLFRHDGKALIGFADGRVTLVTPDEAKALRWTP